ncbi:hypothetical protein [Fulvivirga sedimenti]|uniref:DUF1648 domain-containing protein n=1 Tax=Fulvivirga sedimenti TaxID=2879465 RepID=A0A9X1HPC4_9BACT|nr:hypothetical protein [Fulvivirga sedimenti]MCA6073732.1 hypothetical protein [Fulvivirga sedimenti]
MDSKPKITLRLTQFDWLLETLALTALLICISFTIYIYPSVPQMVSRYIGISGAPVGYYSRNLLWTFPLLSILLYSLVSWVNRRPHLYNYPREITADNAIHFYLLACRWVRLVKLIFMGGFAYTTLLVLRSYSRMEKLPDDYWILAGAALILAAVIIQILRFRRNKKTSGQRR